MPAPRDRKPKEVSLRYLRSYPNECAWRHNAQRDRPELGPLFEQSLAPATAT